MNNKSFYKSECGKLIQHNKDTNTYCIKNTINKTDNRISDIEFSNLKTKKIKKEEYCRLMNIYFKDKSEVWTFEGNEYQSLDNFEYKNYNLSYNYKLGVDVPYHPVGKLYKRNMILVYHWGKVYYHDISYNGEDVGQLYDTKTLNPVQWCRLKNCSPIFNRKIKKIV